MTVLEPPAFDKLVYHLVPIRRRVVLDNLRLVFGDSLNEGQRIRIAQRFYGHIVRCILELLSMGFLTDRALRDRVRVVGNEILDRTLEQQKGTLVFTGHFGNWEMVPVGGILHFPHLKGKFHVVRRRLVNRLVERVAFGRFYEAGLNVIPKKNSLDRVLEALARNEFVTFIMDQHAKPGREGILVDFFGREAGTFKSLALVARATGAPVVPSSCYRQPDGTHVMRFYEPLKWIEDPDPDREILLNTKAYNSALEKMVLEHPEQWWWVHRRWKIKK